MGVFLAGAYLALTGREVAVGVVFALFLYMASHEFSLGLVLDNGKSKGKNPGTGYNRVRRLCHKLIFRERHHTHAFERLAFDRLKDEYFYPIFLKTEITNLPENFTIRTEFE